MKIGGEGGDRTHGPVARTAVFETARFGHSRTSPLGRTRLLQGRVAAVVSSLRLAVGELTLGTVIFQSVFCSLEEPVRIIRARLARLARKAGRVKRRRE